MTWSELPQDVRTGMRWGGYVVGFLLVLVGGVAVSGTTTASAGPEDRLSRVEAATARQDSVLLLIRQSDARQNSVLEFLSCATLSDLGLEARTPRECAQDYLRMR